MRRLTMWLLGCLLLAGGSLGAGGLRGFDPDKDVNVALRKGMVVLTVPQGAHLKAAFMEVALKPGTPGTLKAGPLPPTTGKDELGDGIWRDRVAVPVSGEGLPERLDLVVTFQACTEGEGGVCYQPTDRILSIHPRLARYQSMVSARPSSKLVCGRQLSSASIEDGSMA